MFNKQQLEIINSTASKLLVNAGPGTGKTTTLVGAAKQYKKDHPKARVALLTFTNQAANEMKDRLQIPSVSVSTIHAFAKRELDDLAYQYDFRVRLLTDDQIKDILRLIIKRNRGLIGRMDMEQAILGAFFYIRFKSDALKNHNRQQLAIYDRICVLYQEYKSENDLFDLTDTPNYLLQKLKTHNQTLHYDKIFIDEAQDLDPVQYELLNRTDGDVFAIGDPHQSIYIFRGATEALFDKFLHDGYTEYTLDYTYRSYQEILDFAEVNLISTRGAGGTVSAIPDDIMRYSPMILCRTNRQVKSILPYYPHAMTIHAAKGLEFDAVIMTYTDAELDEDDEESRNVYYVGCTRAKNHLAMVPVDELLYYLKECKFQNGF